MPFSQQGSSKEAEDLAADHTISVDEAALSQANLTHLTSGDFHFAELPEELTLSNMETEEVVIESQEAMETDTIEEIVETELGAEEIEIETERSLTPEEILPDVKVKTSVPPLRPLTIAPKPTKVPISVKTISGQQLLFLHGTGTGQAIKFIAASGQDLSALSRPLTFKPAIKTMTTQQGANISVLQPGKQVVMKKVVTPTTQKTIAKPITFTSKGGGNIMLLQKADGGQIKFLQSQGQTLTTLPSPTKTITIQQAQEMGLVPSAKFVPQSASTPKHALVLNKAPPKTVKIMPQPQKSPTKILPATQTATTTTTTINKAPQRIILKPAGTTAQTTVLPSGIIQLSSQSISTSQLHQINIPGKGMQYIKFINTSDAAATSTASTITTLKPVQTVQTSTATTNIVLSDVKPTAIAPKAMKPVLPKQVGHLMVLPSNFIQSQPQASKVAIPSRHIPPPHVPQQHAPQPKSQPSSDAKLSGEGSDNIEANGIRPRKPCNCTKSQCLKLYCDCFANGEFCHMCNCTNCFNNLSNEDHRQRAIKACLERNPNAFKPKIGKARDTSGDMAIRKHTKGCNCKRSGCLKNYCECYEAKIACSNNCKCIGCRNIEDSMEKKMRNINFDNGLVNSQLTKQLIHTKDNLPFRSRRGSTTTRQAINFITDQVIEATCQCMLTISEGAEERMQSEEVTKAQIIEELGRCLKEIIDCSSPGL